MSRFHVALSCVPGVGPVAAAKIMAAFPEVERAFGADVERLGALGLNRMQSESIASFSDFALADRILENAARDGQRVLAFSDPEYPSTLRTLHDPPVVVYVKGTWNSRTELAVSVVGTRRPTAYGEETARRLGAALAKSAICTVSGGARGIDGWAHRGALEGGGPTVAVMGCGLDIAYPPEHAELFAQIQAAGGALIGEMPPAAQPGPGAFPRRNRILAALGRACVVVEAGERSGALITARCAMEQGKTVLAVPGRIDHGQSRGTNRLIRDGARPLLEILDVVEEVLGEHLRRGAAEDEAYRTAQRKMPPPSGPAGRIWRALSAGEVDVDELAANTGMAPAEINAVLLELELAGRVVKRPGNRYCLKAEDE